MAYTFQTHKSGDTFAGVTFTLSNQDGPIDVTGAIIEVIFNNGDYIPNVLSRGSMSVLTTTDEEIIITDGAAGEFNIKEQVISWEPRSYSGVLRVKFTSGKIKTYADLIWVIT